MCGAAIQAGHNHCYSSEIRNENTNWISAALRGNRSSGPGVCADGAGADGGIAGEENPRTSRSHNCTQRGGKGACRRAGRGKWAKTYLTHQKCLSRSANRVNAEEWKIESKPLYHWLSMVLLLHPFLHFHLSQPRL